MRNKILEVIDFEKVNLLLEGFNKNTGFVTAILDLDGNILSKSGWRQICNMFHRVHPITNKNCLISDTVLADEVKENENIHIYKCLNGLMDVAVPIFIKDEHVANLFSGQFFYEKPDRNFFIKQAEKYRFDKKEYLNALDKVPVVSEEKVKTAMDFLLNMTKVISDMTIQNIEQIELNNSLKKSKENFRALYDNSPDMHGSISATDLSILECNDRLCSTLGYSREEIIGFPILKLYHHDCIEEVKIAIQQFLKTGIIKDKRFTLKRKDGSKIFVSLNVGAHKDDNGNILHSISTWRDISEQKEAEDSLNLHLKTMEQINLAILKAKNKKEMMSAVLQIVLNVFNVERSWFAYPCDPNTEYWNIPMEKYKVGYPGINKIGKPIKTLANHAEIFKKMHDNHDVIIYNYFDSTDSKDISYKFDVLTQMLVTIKIPNNKPWILGVHQCSYKRIWTENEKKLFHEISFRIEDALSKISFLEELKESETRYKALYENAPLSYQSLNKDGTFKDVNPKWLNLLGYKREEIIGKNYSDFIHPDLKSHFKTNFNNFKKQGFIHNVEFKIKHKKGNYIDISFDGYIGHNADGSFKQTYCVFQDITEQKKIEIALIASEEKFRNLYNNTPIMLHAIDMQGRLISVNKHWLETMGYSEDEVISVKSIDFLTEESKIYAKDIALPAFFKNGFCYDVPYQYVKKNGEIIDVLLTAILEKDQYGNPTQSMAAITDITQHKKSKKALLESQQNFKALTNQSAEGISVADTKGNYTFVNPAFCKLVGWTQSELLKMTVFDVTANKQDKNTFKQTTGDKEKVPVEVLLVKKDGTKFLAEITGKIISVNGKKSALGIVRDITQRKKAEDELRLHKEHLEELVEERTKELGDKNKELERMNKLFVGRELRMIELKKIIKDLKNQYE